MACPSVLFITPNPTPISAPQVDSPFWVLDCAWLTSTPETLHLLFLPLGLLPSHLSPPSRENLVPFQRPQGSTQSLSLGQRPLSQLSHHQPSIPPLGRPPALLPRPTYFVTNSPSTRALPSGQLFSLTFSYLLRVCFFYSYGDSRA